MPGKRLSAIRTSNVPDQRTLFPEEFNRPNVGGRPIVPLLQGRKPALDPAPLVGVFLGCVLAGTILGFALPVRRPRLILMSLLCCAALATLITQMVLGFPLKDKTPEDILNFLQGQAPNQMPARARLFIYSTHYTAGLYLTLAVVFRASLASWPTPLCHRANDGRGKRMRKKISTVAAVRGGGDAPGRIRGRGRGRGRARAAAAAQPLATAAQ